MVQDLGFEALKLGAGVQAEVLDEGVAGAAVGVECVRLAARAVEGEHQLGVEALAVRMVGGEAFELGDELRAAAEVQLELEAAFERVQTGALEPVGVAAGGPVERRVRQRRAAKQCERPAQKLHASSGGAVRACADSASNCWRSSVPTRTAYPEGRVSIVSGPSSRRSWETWTCRALVAVAGGVSSHRTSIRRVAETAPSR